MRYLLELIEYDKYQDLSRKLFGESLNLLVFGSDLQPLWGFETELDTKNLRLVERFQSHAASVSRQAEEAVSFVNEKLQYEVFPLVIDENILAYLVFEIEEGVACAEPTSLLSMLRTVENHMVNEYQMIRDLHCISEELTDRYEELNLVYDDTHNTKGHHDVLNFQSLAESCVHFLGVDYALVSLPEKNVALQAPIRDKSTEIEASLTIAAKSIYKWLQENNREFVVNEIQNESSLCKHLDPKFYYVASPITSSTGNVIGMILLANHAAERKFGNSDKNLCAVMSRRAGKIVQNLYDDLTGIFRRSEFESKIEFTLEKILPLDESCCVMGINIQRMHVINENHGIDFGDKVIQAVSQRVNAQLRHHDIIGRISGDVFGILVRHCDVDRAQILANKLLDAVIDKPLTIGGTSISVNAVVGIVTMRLEDNAGHLLSCLGRSFEVAAAKGGDCVELYRHENLDIAQRKDDVYWVGQIQRALTEDSFELYCQGIFNVDDFDRAHHYEVLLRLRDEHGSIASPNVFLPAAKRYNLMSKIDFWVVENTIKCIASAQDSVFAEDFSVAINLSGQTLSHSDFPAKLSYWLSQYSLPASYLAFEITEGETIDHIDKAQNCIGQLRSLGCDIYLDDFGTGLSSFSYLQNLTFDVVKIDGCFIKDIENDAVSRSMVSAICMVAAEIGLDIVAEFVEDIETVPLLKSLGVTHLQGYALHQPQEINSVLSTLLPEPMLLQGNSE